MGQDELHMMFIWKALESAIGYVALKFRTKIRLLIDLPVVFPSTAKDMDDYRLPRAVTLAGLRR